MANWFVDSVGYTAVAQWAALNVYGAGAIVRQLAAPNIGSERCFETTAGGISAAGEPVWNLGHGASQPTDGTVTDWVEVTGSGWSAPFAREGGAFAMSANISSIANGGTGGTYAVGDILTCAGMTVYGDAPLFKVTTVNAGKVTAAATVVNAGSAQGGQGSITATTANGGQGGGTGTGCTINLAFTANVAAGDTIFLGDDHAETQSSALTITAPGTVASPNFIYCVDHTKASPGTGDLKTTATITTTGVSNITLSGSFYCYGITFNCGTGGTATSLVLNNSTAFASYEDCVFALLSTNGSGRFNTGPSALNSGRVFLKNCSFQVSNVGQLIAQNGDALYWSGMAGAAITGATVPSILIQSANGPVILEGVDLSAFGSGKTIAQPNGGNIYLKDCKLGASVTVSLTPTSVNGDTFNIRSDSSGTNYRSEKYSYTGTETTETSITRVGGATDGTTRQSRKYVTTANSKWVLPFQGLPLRIWNPFASGSHSITLYGTWNNSSVPNNDQIWCDLEYLGTSGSPLGVFATATKSNNLATGTALTVDTSTWNGGGSGAGWSPFSMQISFSPTEAGYLYIYPKVADASSTFWLDPAPVLS